MKHIILLCSIILLMSSCMTTRLERQQQRKQAKCDKFGCYQSVSDSIMIIKETATIREDTTIYIHLPGLSIHDTLIQVKPDPVNGLINSKKSVLEVPFAYSYAWVENGRLRHRLFQKDSIMALKIQDAIRITREQERLYKIKQPPPVKINFITDWQWFQIWLGRVILIIGLVLACVIFTKNKRVFFKGV